MTMMTMMGQAGWKARDGRTFVDMDYGSFGCLNDLGRNGRRSAWARLQRPGLIVAVAPLNNYTTTVVLETDGLLDMVASCPGCGSFPNGWKAVWRDGWMTEWVDVKAMYIGIMSLPSLYSRDRIASLLGSSISYSILMDDRMGPDCGSILTP